MSRTASRGKLRSGSVFKVVLALVGTVGGAMVLAQPLATAATPWTTKHTHVGSASAGSRHHDPSPTTTAPTTMTPPKATSTTTTAPPSSGPSAFGMSVPYFLGQSSSYLPAAMANMHSIGLRWIRVDADWSYIQPTSQSSFAWYTTDPVVNAATAAGMNVLLVIDDSPSWASSTGSGGTFTQPASAAAFATFAAAVAAHYGPMGVHTYEIWNEENVHYFWLPSPNPNFYTSMLVAADNAIKAAQPSSTVLSGGMAPSETSGGDYSPIDWLSDIYSHGGGGHFDAVANHPYTFPQLPNDAGSNWSQMTSLRNIMVTNGDGAKQIWLTEFGAPSAGSGGVGTTGQTTQITQAVQDAKTTPWIGALFIHTYQDQASSPDYFGLLNADGSAKPAWAALAAALG